MLNGGAIQFTNRKFMSSQFANCQFINQNPAQLKKWFFTACGMVTILMWSSNIYLLKETLDIYGYVAGIGLIYLLSGVFGLLLYIYKTAGFEKIKNKNYDGFIQSFTPLNKHTLVIYICLIANNIFSSLSFGTSPENEVLLQVIIISDMWTLLINILLILILHYKIRNAISFSAGIIIGIIGIVIACVGFNFNDINFVKYFTDYYYCYFFAIITALAWSYYSVYIKKYETMVNDDHIFISALVSGLIMIPCSFANSKFNNYGHIENSFRSVGLMMYETIIACSLAYYLWNVGFKYGNAKAISNFSILAPLLNICFTSAFYNLNVMYNIIFGSILLICAALFCKHGMSSPVGESLHQISMQNKIYKLYRDDVTPKQIGSSKQIKQNDTFNTLNNNTLNNNTLKNALIYDEKYSEFL